MKVRDRLTKATAALMQRHGVAGTGLAEVITASGVARRSIYLNFPGGKAELVAAATVKAGEDIAITLNEYLSEADPIAAIIRMWSETLVDSDFDGGCPILAAACSRDESPAAATAAAAAFSNWTELIGSRLVHDGIPAGVADSLATTIVAAIEGAAVIARAQRSTRPLEQASLHLEELIGLHSPRKRRRTPKPYR